MENEDKKCWRIPVSWEMYGTVVISADTLEEAIQIAEEDDSIGLPEGSYIDGSWRVDEEPEYIREFYNKGKE